MTGVLERVAPRVTGTGVVELVGPAGSGKSSLLYALTAMNSRARSGPSLWGLPRHKLVQAAIGLTPSLVKAGLKPESLHPDLVFQMVRVDALARVLRERSARPSGVLIVDEGPVFALSWMEVFHPERGAGRGNGWRARKIAEWSEKLDALVRLDADDAVLADRIRRRAKEHPVKNLSFEEIRTFTDSFRRAFDRVIGEITAIRPLEVFEVRTDLETDLGVGFVDAALREIPHGR